jgi:mevalonate kinase
LYWSGQPADTRQLVAKFNSWVKAGDKLADNDLKYLIGLSHRLSLAWYQAAKTELFSLIDDANEYVRKISSRAGMNYWLPIHTDISDWAEGNGGRAKPTGAGGGDMILLVGDLPCDQLDGFIIRLI